MPPLSFDTSLFGYPVGRCQVGPEWDEAAFLQCASAYDLVYLFSEAPLQLRYGSFLLADTKLFFEKKTLQVGAEDPGIAHYQSGMSDALLALALESGVYSRFHTDPGFVRGEYEKLYRRWLAKSLDQQQLLLAERESGFVSYHTSGDTATIDLIAVAPSQRGRGWGRRLVGAAEGIALASGAQSLLIGTQEANVPAVGLYHSLGYRIIERMLVYHWWRKR